MIKKIFAIPFFLTPFLCFSGHAVIEDTKSSWNILVADLVCGVEESSEISYIGKRLSSAIYKELSVLKTHRLSEGEITAMQLFLKEELLDGNRKTLKKYYEDYDKLLFEGKGASVRKALKDDIRAAERALKKNGRIKSAEIKIKEKKDIVFLNGEDDFDLCVKNPLDLGVRAEKEGIDYIVWGSVKRAENIVIADIGLYSRLFGRIVYRTRIAEDIDTLYNDLGRKLEGFNSYILGEEWAKLNVAVDNDDADIFIDLDYAGSGSVGDIILRPGEYTVVVRGNNIEEKRKKIVLENLEILTLDFSVSEAETELFAVSSFPAGADLYYNSVWQGKTPMIINGRSGELLVSLPGYRDAKVYLETAESHNIDLFPGKKLFDPEGYLLKKRNEFYRNLTYFVLSIPVTFLSYADYLIYDDLHARALYSWRNESERRRIYKMKKYSFYGYYGSLFLSATLFANMMFYLKDYIKAGDMLE